MCKVSGLRCPDSDRAVLGLSAIPAWPSHPLLAFFVFDSEQLTL